jgi:hypothetical protein
MAIPKKSLKRESAKPAVRAKKNLRSEAKSDVRLTKRLSHKAYPPDPC